MLLSCSDATRDGENPSSLHTNCATAPGATAPSACLCVHSLCAGLVLHP